MKELFNYIAAIFILVIAAYVIGWFFLVVLPTVLSTVLSAIY